MGTWLRVTFKVPLFSLLAFIFSDNCSLIQAAIIVAGFCVRGVAASSGGGMGAISHDNICNKAPTNCLFVCSREIQFV